MSQECGNREDTSGAWLTGGSSYVGVSFCLKFRNKLDYLWVTEFSCKARRQGRRYKRIHQWIQLDPRLFRGSTLRFTPTQKNTTPGPREGTTWRSWSVTPDATKH